MTATTFDTQHETVTPVVIDDGKRAELKAKYGSLAGDIEKTLTKESDFRTKAVRHELDNLETRTTENVNYAEKRKKLQTEVKEKQEGIWARFTGCVDWAWKKVKGAANWVYEFATKHPIITGALVLAAALVALNWYWGGALTAGLSKVPGDVQKWMQKKGGDIWKGLGELSTSRDKLPHIKPALD